MHANEEALLCIAADGSSPCRWPWFRLAQRALCTEMKTLVTSLRKKAVEFRHVLKMGRTQLQDAVPMTLGQEFNSWANMIDKDIDR